MGKFISAASIGAVTTLTGNAGGAVSPDGAGNIDILGSGAMTVTGTPASNLLTITVADASTTAKGVIEIATNAESIAGASALLAITPASLEAKLGALTSNSVPYGAGTGSAISWMTPGTDGQVIIGATGAAPAFATMTSSGGTIAFTPGANTLNLEVGGSVAVSFPTDSGTAVPALGALTIAGGNNISTSGAGSTVTINVSGTTQYAVQVGDATGSLDSLPVGTTNTVLLGNTGANPSWGQVDLTTDVTGILPVPNGGTGNSTLTDHGIMLGSGASPVTVLGVATDGQLPIGSTGVDPVLANITATDQTLTVTNGAGTIDIEAGTGLRLASGFASWAGGSPYFDDTTLGQFTVSQGGTGYIEGVPVTWAGGQTETGLTAGNTYYIYIDNTGTIGKTTTYSESLFQNNILLFEVLRDSTSPTNNQLTVKENHPYQFPWKTSVWAHDTIGSVISNMSGGANITLNGTQKIEISGQDFLEDHGLETTIPDSGGVAETFEQYYTLGSGKWALHTSSDTFDGTWNNAGTPTALSGNKYSVNRLYVSKDNINSATPVYISVMGDAEYNNLAQADTAIANDQIPTATAELAALELAQLGYIVFEESSTSIVQVIIAKETVRTSFSGATATTASLVLTDTTNFDHILSAADTTVQSALETIDDLTFSGDSGSAQAASAVFTFAGGTGITTSAAGSTVTITLDTPVSVANGGTGAATLTDHGVLVGSGASPITALAVGTDGQVLLGSTGADPVFATLASADSTISYTPGAGSLDLATGSAVAKSFPTDSGTATPSAGALTVAGGNNCSTSGAGSTVTIDVDGNVADSFSTDSGSAVPSLGVLTVTGGDNIDTSGAGSTVTIAVSSAVCDSAATDSGTATPAAGVLTFAGGTNVTTSGAGSTVTINASGGGSGITWNEVTGTSQSAAVDNGYITNNAALVTVTLPATASVGETVRILGLGAGGWRVAQNASQYIRWDENNVTTTGAGGRLDSTDDHDAVELICTVTNNGWGVASAKGNISVT